MAEFNTIESVDGQFRVFNEKLNITNVNYGDVKFATNTKEFKKLNPSGKPAFKNIIFYGQTYIDPLYHYYLLEGGNYQTNDDYTIFDYLFQDKKFQLAVSKNTPAPDLAFIQSHISQYLK